MSYVQMKVYMKNNIEVYKYYSGKLGKKIYNAPAQRKTPINQIKYQDQKASRICGWKIAENFTKDDLWLTLTYPARQPIEPEKARKDISLFLAYLRRAYKKENIELKYIYTAGRTKRGMVHFHMLVNKFDTSIIANLWRKISGGGMSFKHLFLNEYGYVNYKKIADYLIKNSQETFYRKDRIHKKRFCASLNLVMPEIRKQLIKAKEWKLNPSSIKGYLVDKNSIYNGYGWLDNGEHWDCCRVQRYTLIHIGVICNRRRTKKHSLPSMPEIFSKDNWWEERGDDIRYVR